MKVSEELSNLLNMFGLTNYEQITLLSLYQIGPTRADVVSEKTNLKLPRVYEALDALILKNFVEAKGSRPKIFSARNPQSAVSINLDHLKTDFDDKLVQMQNAAANLLEKVEPLYMQHHTDLLPEELLSQFSSLVEAQSSTNNLIQQAEKEILIFTHVFNWFEDVKIDLKNAISRGCSVKIIMQTKLKENSIKIKEIKSLGIEIRTSPIVGIKSRGTIVDNKALVFVIWASETETNSPKRIYRPQFSTNQGIVDVFTGYFHYLWGV